MYERGSTIITLVYVETLKQNEAEPLSFSLLQYNSVTECPTYWKVRIVQCELFWQCGEPSQDTDHRWHNSLIIYSFIVHAFVYMGYPGSLIFDTTASEIAIEWMVRNFYLALY